MFQKKHRKIIDQGNDEKILIYIKKNIYSEILSEKIVLICNKGR